MEITNFKLKTFVRQEKELVVKYLTALRFLNPVETKNKLSSLTLREVEFFKKNINSPNDDVLYLMVSKIEGIDVKKVSEMKILRFFGVLASIRNQLEKISNAEAQLVPEIPNLKWDLVGGSEVMGKYGVMNTVKFLAKGDHEKYDFYLGTRYSKVFSWLMQDKEDLELAKKMDKIKLNIDA